ncbi:MAG TPA: PQQ-dependent sugar dehydrogenase [Kofleriaceae bacterium]
MRLAPLVLGFLVACGGGNDNSDGGNHPDGSAGSDAAQPDADTSCPDPEGTFQLATTQLATGLDQPVYIAQPPGSTDLFVIEKPGRVRILRSGAVLDAPFLTVSPNIPGENAEGGLLGIAFNPDYDTTGRFFVYMTLGSPDRAAVVEYHRSDANHDVADPDPVVEFPAAMPQSGYNNVGGTIAFGPDGYLWLATGDSFSEPNSPAQNLQSRLGKILRFDVDHPMTAPPGGIAGADPFVWDYGLRNPYRFSFDSATGQLYLGDAGDTLEEEVDIEEPGQGGHDFGWDRMEGDVCHDGSSSCGDPGTLPQYTLPHASSYSVIIGGTVYRGSAIPAMRCRYVFAVFGTGRIMSFRYDGGTVGHERELTDMFDAANIIMVTSIVADRAGELYMTTINGDVYAITAG